jgi:hypothetical protein
MANHYLRECVNKLNIGLFESVTWTNTNDRGFDASFVNPIFIDLWSLLRQPELKCVVRPPISIKWSNQINFFTGSFFYEFLGDIKSGDNIGK